jgi:hypothetical protein
VSPDEALDAALSRLLLECDETLKQIEVRFDAG